MSTVRALRTAYLAAGAVSVVAAAAGRRGDRLTRIVKPTLMPLLAGTVLARGQRKATATVVAGLAAGWVGDIILMGADGRSDDSRTRARNLNRGSAAFALNQVAYIAELSRAGHRPRKSTVALRAPVLASGVVTAATGAPAALPAAVGYGSLLAGTSVLAADEGETTPLGLGGNLFVLSDGLILARQAFLTGEKPVVRVLDGLVDGLVMATYVAAQLLLVEGLTGEPTRG
ncbi:lysoplasmalogenase family protein [Corynebacterium variabile]|uniref:lysoplasmalogenase family protein n=1 Tax=Corynebacterium variabile TaxID=1727 RepID=UPI003A953D29